MSYELWATSYGLRATTYVGIGDQEQAALLFAGRVQQIDFAGGDT